MSTITTHELSALALEGDTGKAVNLTSSANYGTVCLLGGTCGANVPSGTQAYNSLFVFRQGSDADIIAVRTSNSGLVKADFLNVDWKERSPVHIGRDFRPPFLDRIPRIAEDKYVEIDARGETFTSNPKAQGCRVVSPDLILQYVMGRIELDHLVAAASLIEQRHDAEVRIRELEHELAARSSEANELDRKCKLLELQLENSRHFSEQVSAELDEWRDRWTGLAKAVNDAYRSSWWRRRRRLREVISKLSPGLPAAGGVEEDMN